MNDNKFERAKRFFIALGQIGDSFLDEANPEEKVVQLKTRKNALRYGAVGAAASIGVLAAVLILRPRISARKSTSEPIFTDTKTA